MKIHGYCKRVGKTRAYAYGIYKTWLNMRKRCRNKNDISYSRYGGRGITVCKEWDVSFEAFLADMGEKPEGKTLDRIDNNDGYRKENCRWSTWVEQCLNRRSNKLITAFGKTQHLIFWAKESGLKCGTIAKRLRLGWTSERAVSQPIIFPGQGHRSDLCGAAR